MLVTMATYNGTVYLNVGKEAFLLENQYLLLHCLGDESEQARRKGKCAAIHPDASRGFRLSDSDRRFLSRL